MTIPSGAQVQGRPSPFPDVPMATLNVLPNGAIILCRWRALDEDWVVLCYFIDDSSHRYVTWHTDDQGRADHGRYFQTYGRALTDFVQRIDEMSADHDEQEAT